MKTFAAVAVLATILSGCLPQPPGESKIIRTTLLENSVELHLMNKYQYEFPSDRPGAPPELTWKPSNRNLILVATDEEIQKRFSKQISEAYRSKEPIRLEDISWWLYAGKIQNRYDQVIRIPYSLFSKETLWQALEYMEKQGKPYDLFLLTHGLPNHIVTSSSYPLISWKQLAELKGKLLNLELIFNQACFGDSLNPDWKETGAKTIISYSGLNRNFFYLGFFLDKLRKAEGDIQQGFAATNSTISKDLAESKLYRKIIETLGMSVEEYMETAPNPELSM